MSINKAQFTLTSPMHVSEVDAQYVLGTATYQSNFSASRVVNSVLTPGSYTADTFYQANASSDNHILSGSQVNFDTATFNSYALYPRANDGQYISKFDSKPLVFKSTMGSTAGLSFIPGKMTSINLVGSDGSLSTWLTSVAAINTVNARILGEDATFLYMLVQYKQIVSSVYTQIVSINKNTKALATIKSSPGLIVLLEDNDNSYIFATAMRGSAVTAGYSAANISYFSLSKLTWTVTSTYSSTGVYWGTTTAFSGGPSNVTTDKSKTNSNKHYVPRITGTALSYMRVPTVPNADVLSGLMISTDAVACTMIGTPAELVAAFAAATASNGYATLFNQNIQNYILTADSKEYLIISNTPDRSPASNRPSTAGTRFIAVYEINNADSTSLTFKSVFWPAEGENGVLFSNDFQTIVLASTSRIRILSFNSSTVSYTDGPYVYYNSAASINKVILDRKSQLWICESSGLVTVLNPSNTVLASVTAVNKNQQVDSYPAAIQFVVTTQTARGALLNRTVKLKVTNGKFADDTLIKSVTTVNGTITVPVTVTTPGIVTVDIIED